MADTTNTKLILAGDILANTMDTLIDHNGDISIDNLLQLNNALHYWRNTAAECSVPPYAATEDAYNRTLACCLRAAFNRSLTTMAGHDISGSISVAGQIGIGLKLCEVQLHITADDSDWFGTDALPEQFNAIPNLTPEGETPHG